MKLILYAVLSVSLLYIGEYSTFVVFQVATLLFSQLFFYYLYLPFIHLILLKIFASLHYPLYFILLFFTVYVIYKDNRKICANRLAKLSLFYISLLVLYNIIRDRLYDLYVWSNIQDRVNYISVDVAYILTLLHLFILFFLTFEYNGKNKNY